MTTNNCYYIFGVCVRYLFLCDNRIGGFLRKSNALAMSQKKFVWLIKARVMRASCFSLVKPSRCSTLNFALSNQPTPQIPFGAFPKFAAAVVLFFLHFPSLFLLYVPFTFIIPAHPFNNMSLAYDWVQVVDPRSSHTFFANPVSYPFVFFAPYHQLCILTRCNLAN